MHTVNSPLEGFEASWQDYCYNSFLQQRTVYNKYLSVTVVSHCALFKKMACMWLLHSQQYRLNLEL